MTKIGIFGFGNMGQALFKILKPEEKYDFFIFSEELESQDGARVVGSLEELAEAVDFLFICIKPQEFAELEKVEIKNKDLIIVSIMAGVLMEKIQEFFPDNRVIRCMPNLNLQVGKGVVGWCAQKDLFSPEELETAEAIFNKCGLSIPVEEEDMLNAVTAVSGSGPAYVFLFLDSLLKAAESLGFSHKEAEKIVLETIKGSLKYYEYSGISAPDLIKKVASKKGTTEAALESLGISSYKQKWEKAVKQARNRAQELSDK